MRKWIIRMTVISAAVVPLAACGSFGESHNYNSPAPKSNIVGQWVRLESPGNYHTIIRACFGKDGVYLDQSDNNSVTVVPNDPDCVGGVR
jgi:hypothetical protein